MVCFIFGVFLFFKDLPSDCSQLFERGERVSSVYAIRPHGSQPIVVFCDMSKGRTLESATSTAQAMLLPHIKPEDYQIIPLI